MKLTYADKVALNENSEVAEVNKVTAGNMNDIKKAVNTNYDEFKNSTNVVYDNTLNVATSKVDITCDLLNDGGIYDVLFYVYQSGDNFDAKIQLNDITGDKYCNTMNGYNGEATQNGQAITDIKHIYRGYVNNIGDFWSGGYSTGSPFIIEGTIEILKSQTGNGYYVLYDLIGKISKHAKQVKMNIVGYLTDVQENLTKISIYSTGTDKIAENSRFIITKRIKKGE